MRNLSILTPGSSEWDLSVADGDRGASGNRDLLEPAFRVGAETDPLTVR